MVDIQKVNRDRLLREWAEMVSQCRNSGQTVATWCAEHGINCYTFEAIVTQTRGYALRQNAHCSFYVLVINQIRSLVVLFPINFITAASSVGAATGDWS